MTAANSASWAGLFRTPAPPHRERLLATREHRVLVIRPAPVMFMPMRIRHLLFAAAWMFLLEAVSHAEVKVAAEHSAAGSGFTFKSVPAPANNDAATTAQFTLVDGARDPNGGDLAVLHDGRVPSGEDQPSDNFFFRAGTDGGRIQIDLGRVISVKQVGTYSWHV